jgi:6-pyruvoyltetrahydropterin/6-carboxytetrahydropterin synthase
VTDEFELRSAFSFEAAHHLPEVAADHRCRRTHGHSYNIEVRVTGPAVAPYGWVVDLAQIERACATVKVELDHRLLNDIHGLENPTSEMLARWIWRKLAPDLQGLAAISVRETQRSACVYRGPQQAGTRADAR